MKQNIKKDSRTGLLWGAGLALCLLLILYPLLSDLYDAGNQSILLREYRTRITAAEDRERYAGQWETCRQYNEALYAEQRGDAAGDRAPYESLLQEGSGQMACISIPAIRVTLPVYHYADTFSLEKGAGHMQETSLPVGGRNTHAVISAHTGSAEHRFFTDLEQLRTGDRFFLYVLDECHVYRVCDIRVVLPEETDALRIAEGRDLCTLVTCTPYGINSHRLLVTGERDPEAEAAREAGSAWEQVPAVEDEDRQDLTNADERGGSHRRSTWMRNYSRALRKGICACLLLFFAGILLFGKHRHRDRIHQSAGRKREKLSRILLTSGILLLSISLAFGSVVWYRRGAGGARYTELRRMVMSGTDQTAGDAAFSEAFSGDEDPGSSSGQESDVLAGLMESDPNFPHIDYAALEQACPELVCWIYMPGTNISYPVMRVTEEKDASYWLTHLYNGEKNRMGAIFLDPRCAGVGTGDNTIIYGHNLKSGDMFRSLYRFTRDPDYAEDHLYFYLLEKDRICRCRILTAAQVDQDPDYWRVDLSPDSDIGRAETAADARQDWLRSLQDRSCIPEQLPPAEDTNYVTLSTCAYLFDGARLLVTAELEEILNASEYGVSAAGSN